MTVKNREGDRTDMKSGEKILAELLERYPALCPCGASIRDACGALLHTAEAGGKILLCGNGGSCADCGHISGELLKGFLSKRPLSESDRKKWEPFEGGRRLSGTLQYGVCAIPLPAMTAAMTAFGNDVSPEAVYAQLVLAMGKSGDALLCISTSGSSKNVVNAAVTAKALGIACVGLTGETGGRLAELCDVCIRVPGTETFKIQELHLPVYHCICAALEAELFRDRL